MDTSELQEIILHVVASIPQGNVASYGQVAKLAGYPGHARYVGTVLKKLPSNSKLPWHRVINAKGEIAFPVGSKRYIKQLSLLAEESVMLIKEKYRCVFIVGRFEIRLNNLLLMRIKKARYCNATTGQSG